MKEENTYHEMENSNLPDSLRVNSFSVPQDFFKHQEENIHSQISLGTKINTPKESLSVPVGYFESLQSNILTKIAEQNLKNHVCSTGFIVSDNYFEELTDSIQVKRLESKLKDSIAVEGFVVPESYFESSQANIFDAIAEDKLRAIASNDGFTVPTGYFDEFSERIFSAISIERLVNSTQEKNFVVPTGYFESLSSKIMEKVKADELPEQKQTDTPVIKMSGARKNWAKYTTAAAITLLIGLGSYWFLDIRSTDVGPQDAQASLDEISNEELVNYLVQVSDSEDLIELATYISNDRQTEDSSFDVNEKVKDKEIEEYLKYML